MRVKKENIDLNYDETRKFFDKRADKFNEKNPYTVTMYQDNHPEIVEERNKKEILKLKPILKIDRNTRLLDVACGIGRWADAITEEIQEYCGVDFSTELIDLAKKRNTRENFSFIEGSVVELQKVLMKTHKKDFNKILMAGILIYLNDRDVCTAIDQIEMLCSRDARIYMREPVATEERLTLKDFYSDELCDNYNAIYRTRDELVEYMENTVLKKGFHIIEEGYLFDEEVLNNRKETVQYYFVLERKI